MHFQYVTPISPLPRSGGTIFPSLQHVPSGPWVVSPAPRANHCSDLWKSYLLAHHRSWLLSHPDPNVLAQQKQNKVEIKNSTFNRVGDLVIQPNWRRLWSECRIENTDLPFLLLVFVPGAFLECEHLVPSIVFLLFIDFNYCTTSLWNPSQLVLLVLKLRNQIQCCNKRGCVGLDGGGVPVSIVRPYDEIFQGEFWTLSICMLFTGFSS